MRRRWEIRDEWEFSWWGRCWQPGKNVGDAAGVAQAVQDGDFAPGIREPWQELRDFIVQASLPSSTSKLTPVAVNTFVTEARGNTLSLLVGTPSSTLANP